MSHSLSVVYICTRASRRVKRRNQNMLLNSTAHQCSKRSYAAKHRVTPSASRRGRHTRRRQRRSRDPTSRSSPRPWTPPNQPNLISRFCYYLFSFQSLACVRGRRVGGEGRPSRGDAPLCFVVGAGRLCRGHQRGGETRTTETEEPTHCAHTQASRRGGRGFKQSFGFLMEGEGR